MVQVPETATSWTKVRWSLTAALWASPEHSRPSWLGAASPRTTYFTRFRVLRFQFTLSEHSIHRPPLHLQPVKTLEHSPRPLSFLRSAAYEWRCGGWQWSAQARAYAVEVFQCHLERACVPVRTDLVHVCGHVGVVVVEAGSDVCSATCFGRCGKVAVAAEVSKCQPTVWLERESSDFPNL